MLFFLHAIEHKWSLSSDVTLRIVSFLTYKHCAESLSDIQYNYHLFLRDPLLRLLSSIFNAYWVPCSVCGKLRWIDTTVNIFTYSKVSLKSRKYYWREILLMGCDVLEAYTSHHYLSSVLNSLWWKGWDSDIEYSRI